MFCRYCGQELDEGTPVCTACGKKTVKLRPRLRPEEESPPVEGGEVMTVVEMMRQFLGRMWGRLIPYRSIEQTEGVRAPLAPAMVNALELWYRMYQDRAPWKKPGMVKRQWIFFIRIRISHL